MFLKDQIDEAYLKVLVLKGLRATGLRESAFGMQRYPTISVDNGYFTIVDNFLISLLSKDGDGVAGLETISPEARRKVRLLIKLYKPDMFLRLESMSSNFLIIGHSLLFEILTEKVYVNFVRTRGRYYCRKISANKATHIALSVRMTKKKGPRCSKYLVYENPLRQQSSDFKAILKQQAENLTAISAKKLAMFFRSDTLRIDLEQLDVKLLREDELLMFLRRPLGSRLVEQVPELMERKIVATENFQRTVLDFCEKRSICKLKGMTQVLLEIPNLVSHSSQVKKLYSESEALIQKNLSLASQKIFPLMLKQLSHEDAENYEKVSDRLIVIDGLLIDVPSKMAIDPEGPNILSSATLEEKRRLKRHSLISWALIRSEKHTIKVRTRKLIHFLDQHPQKFISEPGPHSEERAAEESKNLTQYYVRLKFEDLGWKCVFVEALGLEDYASLENKALSALESPKLKPEVIGTLSFSDLIESFKRFCSYEEQESLYLETVWKLMEGKTS